MSAEVESDNPHFCIGPERLQTSDLRKKVVFCEIEIEPGKVEGVYRKALSPNLARIIFDCGLIDRNQLDTALRFRQSYQTSSIAARPNSDVSDRVADEWRRISRALRELSYRQRIVAIEVICSDHLVKGITSTEVRSTLDRLAEYGY